MNIKADNFKIELTHDELWDLAFCVFHRIENTLKNHWVNHQNVWEKSEERHLKLLKELFTALGRPDCYENIFYEQRKIFKEFNDKKQPPPNL